MFAISKTKTNISDNTDMFPQLNNVHIYTFVLNMYRCDGAVGLSVHPGVSRVLGWKFLMDDPCHSRRGTLKNPRCSMAIGVEHRSKFAAFHQLWWRHHMGGGVLSGTKNQKTNKQRIMTLVFFTERSLNYQILTLCSENKITLWND